MSRGHVQLIVRPILKKMLQTKTKSKLVKVIKIKYKNTAVKLISLDRVLAYCD